MHKDDGKLQWHPSGYHQAVMNLIVRANWERMKEESCMCEALRELFFEVYADELKEVENNWMRKGEKVGIEKGERIGIEKGERIGIEKGESRGIMLTKTVFRLTRTGNSVEEIAEKCDISRKKVLEILQD